MKREMERIVAWVIVAAGVVAGALITWWMVWAPESLGGPLAFSDRSQRPDGPGEIEEIASRLDALVPRLMRRYGVPGVGAAIVRGGEPVWSAAYGVADRESARPMQIDSVFQVGSISKSLTAWGVMALVERGMIDLDAPVRDYLRSWDFPEPGGASDQVTVRALLSNTAGMPLGSFGNEHDPRGEVPPLREALSRQARPEREPGVGFSYSNVGFNLLELLIEEVTGREFAEFMRAELLEPIDMATATFAWTDEVERAVATGYDLSGTPIAPYVYPEKASGGLFATVDDIARFVVAGATVADGPASPVPPVVRRSALELMYEPHARIGGAFGVVADWYGLGHFLEELPDGTRAAWHGGQGLGWMGHYHTVPATGDGIVILTNSQRSWPMMARILGLWGEWSGIGAAKFTRISIGVGLLWVLLALLAVGTGLVGVRVARGLFKGDRHFAPLARHARWKRASGFAIGSGVLVALAWASVQPYLMVTSVFPGVSDWGAAVAAAAAVVLIAAALVPKERSI
jgi:CubicO group peptidase (beta-lactamase class C family)